MNVYLHARFFGAEKLLLKWHPPISCEKNLKRQQYERTTETYPEGLLFRHNRCPAQGEYNVQAYIYLIELPAPIEELLTVAIDDTANTLFITGITGSLCH